MTKISAPYSGDVVALPDVPDSVFAQGIVGAGLALKPQEEILDVCSPVSGKLVKVMGHAAVIRPTGSECGVLIHLGIDTVTLKGRGFDWCVSEGQVVEAEEKLLTWDTRVAEAEGCSLISPVVVMQREELTLLAHPGEKINAGTPLIEC